MRISEKYDVSVNDVINYIRRPKQEFNKRNEDSKGLIIGAAVAGFAVGCTIALLYTPESGNELREDLSKILREANDKLVTLASDALDRVS